MGHKKDGSMRHKKSCKIFFCFCLFLFFSFNSVYAASCIGDDCRPHKNIVGTIQKIRLDISRIFVLDEDTDRVWDFFAHSNLLKRFKEGERVRIYYVSIRLPVVSIKKMTPLKASGGNQNQGFIFKSPK